MRFYGWRAMKGAVSPEIIGLIPAGGFASRFGKLPCSKELLPVGIQEDSKISGYTPKVLIADLIEKMKRASIEKIFIILKKGKWDIPNYLGDGSELGVNIGYLMQNLPYGVPFTLDQAFPFVAQNPVVLGFPDTIYKSRDVFAPVLKRLARSNAQVVLGLFPADENADRVDIDTDGIVRRIIVKAAGSNLKFAWSTAAWQPEFSRFLHAYVSGSTAATREEIHIGQVIQASIESGFIVAGVRVSEYQPIDIGNALKLKNFWVQQA